MRKSALFIAAAVISLAAAGCGADTAAESEAETAAVSSAAPAESKDEDESADASEGEVKTVTVDELTGDEQIIDVREEEQYIGWTTDEGEGGHIVNAVDFPESWTDIAPEDYAIGTDISTELVRRGLDTSEPVVIYDNDTASEETAEKYAKLGFTDISVLEGGYSAYVEAGKETDSLPGYQIYVYPDWVEALANGESPEGYDGRDFKIIEVSLSSEDGEYESGHIKGAINLKDTFNHIEGPRVLAEYENIPMEEQLKFWNRPDDSVIRENLENLGITKDTMVVLYATTPATTASHRAGMLMRYAGVEDIRFLNGGKTLWKLQGRDLETEANIPDKTDFGAEVPVNPDVVYDYDEELEVVNDANAVAASIRSWPEYTGEVSGYTYIGEAGEIANSRFGYAGSDPYSMEDFRNIDNTMFNYGMIKDRWERWGIVPEKRISFHCGTGWRASETYWYAEALGYPDIHVYDGGWYEWSKRPGSPVMDKGVPADAPEQTPQEFFKVEK